ncbi:hypothetical protein ACPC54_40625 [Kitasatospora sp. NPDC094028]
MRGPVTPGPGTRPSPWSSPTPNPAPKARTGRPALYCSRSCRSKMDRAKAKAREAAAAQAAAPAAPLPAPAAAPGPAAAPDHAAPAAAVPAGDDRWGEDGQHLLGLADALQGTGRWCDEPPF